MSQELVFRLLQDRGQTMSDEDKAKFEKKKTKGSSERKGLLWGDAVSIFVSD